MLAARVEENKGKVEKLRAKAFRVRGDCYGVCAAIRYPPFKKLAAKLKCFPM